MGSTSHTILRLGCSIPAARNGGRWRGVEEGGWGERGEERVWKEECQVTPVSSWWTGARKWSPCDGAAAGCNTSGGNAGDAVRQAVKRTHLQPIGEDQTDQRDGEPLTGSRNGSCYRRREGSSGSKQFPIPGRRAFGDLYSGATSIWATSSENVMNGTQLHVILFFFFE